jgi:hypothetical protein
MMPLLLNELFYQLKTMMVFGDAKATLTSLVQLIKQMERGHQKTGEAAY